MKGRRATLDKSTVGKQQSDANVKDVIRAGHMAMKKQGEIAIFDADIYFGTSAGNQRSRMKEMEDDLDEDANAEVGGDLPLSPLPGFYTISKAKHCSRRDERQQGDRGHVYAGAYLQNVPAMKTPAGGAIPSPAAQRKAVTSGDNLPSPRPVASGRVDSEPPAPANIAHDAQSQSRSTGSKSQPFSPSARFASFLAKFKLSSSESKSKPSSQYAVATPAMSTGTPKSFHSSAGTPPPNSKTPSPRSRFLRALSSSSSHSNFLLKPVAHKHHHSSIAVSTPVSPAGSDPYSPITYSASTTPTSRKNPRSRPRSYAPHHEGATSSLTTTDWQQDLNNANSRSLTAHLPFLRRKLKAYLMPEKSPRQYHENHHQPMNTQEKVSMHQVGNGAPVEDRQRRANKASMSVSDMRQVVSNTSDTSVHEWRQQRGSYKVNASSMDKVRAAGYLSPAHMPEQLDQHHNKPHHNRLQSPGHRLTEPPPTVRDTRRRSDWRRHAEEMEDDIEVAERLLRVVKEHQSSRTYTSSSNYRQQRNGYAGYQANGHGVEMNESSRRKSRKSLVSPSGSPAAKYHSKQVSKEDSCPYDSDSSSDLFEIETLQAFSHVAGLYRPRDLPVYESNPLKSPLHIK